MTNHPVIQLIKKRYSEKSKPTQRKDSFKIGLVLEGGGMRGVVGASMATALHYLGLVNVFDAVYGSSAGALAGSLFVTQNMPLGPTIYYDDLVSKDFIDYKNAFSRSKSIMNLDFLLNNILQQSKPLNWQKVIDSKIRLKIIVSSVKKRKLLCIDDYKNKDELFTLLKASATIPFIAGNPVVYKDDLLLDASLYESIPYKSALNDGCTHLFVLLTRPKGITKIDSSFIEKFYFAPKLKKLNPGLEIDYLNRTKEYNEHLKFLYNENSQIDSKPSIYSVFLTKENDPISGLEKNRSVLLEAAKAGMQAVMDVFTENEKIRYHEVLSPFNKYGVIPEINLEFNER
jgi:predicted patatin/cPLA2 family phospholipase